MCVKKDNENKMTVRVAVVIERRDVSATYTPLDSPARNCVRQRG